MGFHQEKPVHDSEKSPFLSEKKQKLPMLNKHICTKACIAQNNK